MIDKILVEAQQYHLTGSSYICDPPVQDTDIDYIVHIDPGVLLQSLTPTHNVQYSPPYPSEFISIRNGVYNFICTASFDFYCRFCLATEEAKRLNLVNKDERIALFQRVLYGK